MVSTPAPSDDAIEIAASGPVSTANDAGCGCHVYGIDATTLSAECQEPCQPSFRGAARTPAFLALQRFAEHRRSARRNLARDSSTRPCGPLRLDARDPPTLRQGFANSVPRVVSDSHTVEDRIGAEAKRSNPVSNPVSRVSVALSTGCRRCLGRNGWAAGNPVRDRSSGVLTLC